MPSIASQDGIQNGGKGQVLHACTAIPAPSAFPVYPVRVDDQNCDLDHVGNLQKVDRFPHRRGCIWHTAVVRDDVKERRLRIFVQRHRDNVLNAAFGKRGGQEGKEGDRTFSLSLDASFVNYACSLSPSFQLVAM